MSAPTPSDPALIAEYVSSTSRLGEALAWLFLVCQRTDRHRQSPFGRCENCGTVMNWDGRW